MRIKITIIVVVICLITCLFASQVTESQVIDNSQNQSALKELPIEMLILTNSTLESKFIDFAKIKNREGIKTAVVNIGTIASSSPELLRTYLKNQKLANSSLKYVILGGDASVIPAYMIHDPENPNELFPSDFYYSNVLSTWTTNYHSLTYNFDLYVGRIPANTTTEVQNFITKYLNYRYNTTASYTKKYRFISNNYARSTNYLYCDSLINRVSNKLNAPIVKQTTNDEQLLTPTAETEGNILNEGNYSFLFTYTHGFNNTCMATINNNCVYPPNYNNPDLTYMNLTINYNNVLYGLNGMPAASYRYLPDYLTNSQAKPFIFWLGSCYLSRFQKLNTSNPLTYVPTDCFMAEFMNNNDGAVATFSSAYFSYANETFYDVSTFFSNLQTNSNKKIGYLTSLSYIPRFSTFISPYYNYKRMSFLSMIYFGDPSMDVWYKDSKTLNVSKTYVSRTSLTVAVTSGSFLQSTVSGATVCVLNADDTIFLKGTTNIGGQIVFTSSSDLTGKKISVSIDNAVPYYNTLALTPNRTNILPEANISQKNTNPEITINYLNDRQIQFNVINSNNSKYKLVIFNSKGQRVNSLSNTSSTTIWNGRSSDNRLVSTGIYFYKFTNHNYEKTGKLTIIK